MSQRLDQWLVFARLVKARSLAEGLIAGRAVRLNGVIVEKGSTAVKVGDRLEVVIGRQRRVLSVLGIAERRGPASTVADLYEEISRQPEAPLSTPFSED